MSFYYNDILHYIKNQNPNLPKTKATTKVLYINILQEGSKSHIIFRECQWKNKIRNLQFSKIWNNTYNSYNQPCTLDLLFRLLHHATGLKQHICKCNRDKKNFSAKCDLCNKTEDNLHLFTQCHRTRKIWNHFEPTYKKLTNKNHTPEQHILKLSVNTTLTQLIIFEIWQSRNNLKYNKTLLPYQTIIDKIKKQMLTIIKADHMKHVTNDTPQLFQDYFCINNAPAKKKKII